MLLYLEYFQSIMEENKEDTLYYYKAEENKEQTIEDKEQEICDEFKKINERQKKIIKKIKSRRAQKRAYV